VAALGPTGASAATSASTTIGATGASDPLSAPIQPNTVLGTFGPPTGFLHDHGHGHGHAYGQGQGNEQKLADQLGAQLTTDLTTVGSSAKVLGPTGPQSGAGSDTPKVAGVGAAFPDQTGKDHLKDVVKPDDHKH